jgi:hypothetical protein
MFVKGKFDKFKFKPQIQGDFEDKDGYNSKKDGRPVWGRRTGGF